MPSPHPQPTALAPPKTTPTLAPSPATPQVAAHSQHHICVRKAVDSVGRMVTQFERLQDRQARLHEVAEMLGEQGRLCASLSPAPASSWLLHSTPSQLSVLGLSEGSWGEGRGSGTALGAPNSSQVWQVCRLLDLVCLAGLPLSAAEELWAAAQQGSSARQD